MNFFILIDPRRVNVKMLTWIVGIIAAIVMWSIFIDEGEKDDLMKFIPTIILTTSSNQKDLLEVYKIGVAGYITKPLKYEDYVEKINRLLNYWSVNELLSK